MAPRRDAVTIPPIEDTASGIAYEHIVDDCWGRVSLEAISEALLIASRTEHSPHLAGVAPSPTKPRHVGGK